MFYVASNECRPSLLLLLLSSKVTRDKTRRANVVNNRHICLLPHEEKLFEIFMRSGSGGLMRLYELFSWYSVIDSGFFSVAGR